MDEQVDITRLLNAAIFAANQHDGQVRKNKDKSPYVTHPIAVTREIHAVGGITDTDILVAALLHDTIEDSKTHPSIISDRFGEKVLSIVQQVTDNKSLDKLERKRRQVIHAPDLSFGARLVKLGDKIVNCRDILKNPPDGWPLKRRQDYIQWAADVIHQVRGTNAALETVFDQILRKAEQELNYKIEPFETISQRAWAP